MNLRTKKQEHTSLSLRFSVLAVVAVARRAAAAAAADGAALRRDPLRWYTIRTPGALLNAPTGPYT
jgi:hypothetical protein